MRTWEILIPIRPKCVQSVRSGRGHFHVDPAVKRWKDSIRPYIRAACPGRPSVLPIRVVRFTYSYRCPKNASKAVRRYIEDGGVVPYLGKADVTDNLNKGVVDVCSGIVYEDDSQIWWTCDIQKVYGIKDQIELKFEETADVMMLNGKTGATLDPKYEEDTTDVSLL